MIPRPFIRRYTEVAPDVFRDHFRPDSCCNVSRVCIDVMKHFGVKAIPLSVFMLVMNGPFFRYMRKHGEPPTEHVGEAEGAWALGTETRREHETFGSWAGHLVVLAQDWLIDSSARQINRPQKNIVLPDIFTGYTTARFRKGRGHTLAFDMPDGGMLTYVARLEDRSYEDVPGFQPHAKNREVADEIIIAMTRGKSKVG